MLNVIFLNQGLATHGQQGIKKDVHRMEKSYFKGQIRENKISKSETAFQILLWAQDLLIGENKAVCFNKKKQKRAR